MNLSIVPAKSKRRPEPHPFYLKLDKLTKQTPKTKTGRILRYFPDTHLGNGHDGLAKIAKKKGVDVTNLRVGEYVVFVNTTKTALKLYAPGNIVSYLKMPGTQRLNLGIIRSIPMFFNGTEIDYKGALKSYILKQLGD